LIAPEQEIAAEFSHNLQLIFAKAIFLPQSFSGVSCTSRSRNRTVAMLKSVTQCLEGIWGVS
jgi:hypothetical protein